MAKQTITADTLSQLLGKRQSGLKDDPGAFLQKATDLGFTSQELRELLRLYGLTGVKTK